MRVVALISGGKDSCFNMMKCVAEGHDIVALANLKPKDKDELDSYMYQTVGHHAIDLYADAMSLPLYRRVINGTSKEIGENYQQTADDEVEDLYCLLKEIKAEIDFEGVSVGAILSNYQRVRVENVCERLGLTSLAFLWRRDQDELLQEMISCGVSAILIKVAGLGLLPDKHLGKTLQEIYPHMVKMDKLYGLNICGEGGEYETFTLDCPLFNKQMIIDETELVIHSDIAFCPVGYLNLKRLHLEDKHVNPSLSLKERVKDLPLVKGHDLVKEAELSNSLIEEEIVPEPMATQPDFNTDMNVVRRVTQDNHFWISGIHFKQQENCNIKDVAEEVMKQFEASVRLCGGELSDVVAVFLYVRTIADFSEINSVYKQSFKLNPPCRVCVQVNLPANIPIQIDCYGYLPNNEESGLKRHTMHVQGLSHWAPANIGPYSQAVKLGDRIYVAGQIALVPASLQIIQGGITTQAELSLSHVSKILRVMHNGCDLKNISLAICYVTRKSHIQPALEVWQSALKSQSLDEREQSPQGSPLLNCVVVPTLPKSALVEWQVYAQIVNTEDSGENTNLHGEVSEVSLNFDVTLTYLKNAGSPLTCVGTVCRTSDDELCPSDVIGKIFTCYKTALGRIGKTLSDLPAIRILYHVRSFTHEALYTAIRSFFESSEDFPVPVSLIPVEELSHLDCVLTFCH